jgi:hypothetical protein
MTAAETALWTFQDLVEHLLDVFDLSRAGRKLRGAKRAALAGYRSLYRARNWSHSLQKRSLQTTASYGTGTLVYDHTGGTNEREVTLTGGAWPSDAAFGYVIISQVHYEVETRVSDTVLTLSVNSNPAADVAATAYLWYRDSYPLPINFITAGNIIDVTSVSKVLEYVDPNEFLQRKLGYVTTGQPWYYSIFGDHNYFGTMAIGFGQPPATARTYEYMMRGEGNSLRVEKYSTGTVSTSGTTVTGVGTTFTKHMVGSVLRFGDTTDEPTSVIGDVAGVDNPFVEQRIISGLSNTTTLTIDASITGNIASSTKFTISDPLNIEAGSMLEALHALAEAECARIFDRSTFDDRFAYSQKCLRRAGAFDDRVIQTNSSGGQSGNLTYIANSIDSSFTR